METHEVFQHWAAIAVEAVQASAAVGESPWHDHRHLVVGVVDRGVRIIETRTQRITVGPGMGFVLPGGLVHRCLQPAAADYRALSFAAGAWPSVAFGCVQTKVWRDAFDRAFARVTEAALPPIPDLISLTLAALGPGTPEGPEPRAVRGVRRSLDAAPADARLGRLAAEIGVSPFHLQRLYRRSTGLSPRQAAILVRLRRARALLLDGVPLSEAAVAAGFYDQAHFSRAFKRLMGVAPGAYRRQVLGRQA